MARPRKEGIDYFPLDVDMDHDDKMAMIIAEFGFKGEFIYIKVLSYLYQNYGYFLPWDEVEQLKFANRVSYIGGSSANLFNEVVARCVKWGLFDKAVYDATQAVTSVRIQNTWFEATRKRKQRVVDPKIWLLGFEFVTSETQLIPEVIGFRQTRPSETQLIPEVIPQSKVKESKVERKKENPAMKEATFWERERATFLTNLVFFEQFCMSKKLGAPAARGLQERFLDDLVLKDDMKDARELQRHFTNWFNKGQQDGLIDQQGNMKSAPAVEQSKTPTLNAIEQRTNRILDEIG